MQSKYNHIFWNIIWDCFTAKVIRHLPHGGFTLPNATVDVFPYKYVSKRTNAEKGSVADQTGTRSIWRFGIDNITLVCSNSNHIVVGIDLHCVFIDVLIKCISKVQYNLIKYIYFFKCTVFKYFLKI